jgi:cob(I)alamin adenosyltransferase
MKIYTKTGDAGMTGLFGGGRVSKADVRVCAYGEIDELNTTLGLVRAASGAELFDELLGSIQNSLFDIGAELATSPGRESAAGEGALTEGAVTYLEEAIDRYQASLPELKVFILPGGTEAAARLHLARAVCRRAERAVVHLADIAVVRTPLLVYVNRLSDLLFVLARAANADAGVADIPWRKNSRASSE